MLYSTSSIRNRPTLKRSTRRCATCATSFSTTATSCFRRPKHLMCGKPRLSTCNTRHWPLKCARRTKVASKQRQFDLARAQAVWVRREHVLVSDLERGAGGARPSDALERRPSARFGQRRPRSSATSTTRPRPRLTGPAQVSRSTAGRPSSTCRPASWTRAASRVARGAASTTCTRSTCPRPRSSTAPTSSRSPSTRPTAKLTTRILRSNVFDAINLMYIITATSLFGLMCSLRVVLV